jgi:hypothetical protein
MDGSRFKTKPLPGVKGISIVVGKLVKYRPGRKDSTVTQSYRFDKAHWSKSKARKWMKTHKNPELLILTNPTFLGRCYNKICRAFGRFHWRGPAKVTEVKVPKGVDARYLVKLGNAEELKYETGDDSERTKISRAWTHQFTKKPHICTTEKGDVLIIFGGNLHVTARGIEG